jgi:hypothetical protein
VESEEFLDDVTNVLSEDEHDALILQVAYYPEEGALIPGTGGLRKLRCPREVRAGEEDRE